MRLRKKVKKPISRMVNKLTQCLYARYSSVSSHVKDFLSILAYDYSADLSKKLLYSVYYVSRNDLGVVMVIIIVVVVMVMVMFFGEKTYTLSIQDAVRRSGSRRVTA